MSLPILDPKKVPADWETDIFGLAHPPPAVRLEFTDWMISVWGDPPMSEEYARSLMDRWSLQVRLEETAVVRARLGLGPEPE